MTSSKTLTAKDTIPPTRSHVARLVDCYCIIYLLFITFVTAYLWLEADISWPATLLLFGPRWLFALPLSVSLLLTLCVRTRISTLACVLATFIVAGPLTGGRIAIPVISIPQNQSTLRLLTLNCDSTAVDRVKFSAYVREMNPDVVLLQDSSEAGLPADYPSGWFISSETDGRRAASRFPVRRMDEFHTTVFGPGRGLTKFRVEMPHGDVTLINVHLPTPRLGLEAIIADKPDEVDLMNQVIRQRDQASLAATEWVGGPGPGVIIAGDFNMPVESTIYQRDWAKFNNAFGTAGTGWGQTMFSHRLSVRIDHVLTDHRWKCRSVVIGPSLNSTHRPVVVTLDSELP